MEYYIQLDIKTAFLNGEVEEELYTQQPKGYIKKGEEHLVCRLLKSLYGLKQASRNWNKEHTKFLELIGFKQLRSEDCIYFHEVKQIITLVYVDDLLITGNNDENIKWTKEKLFSKYKVRDLRKANWILGIKIDYNNEVIFLSQQVYVNKLLKRFGMDKSKHMATPIVKQICEHGDHLEFKDNNLYRQVIGTLLFLANSTRPDISYAISYLSRYVQKPLNHHWISLKRIMRYLVGTKQFGLFYSYNTEKCLYAYIDAAYANNSEDRKSTTGCVVYYNNTPIAWSRKKQQVIATSSTEAEYMALCYGFKNILWLRNVLSELKLLSKEPTIVYEDNHGQKWFKYEKIKAY